MSDNLAYCRSYLKRNDPEIYSCLQGDKNDDLIIALFQLNLELSKIPQNSGEKTISFLKLAWWQEVIKELYQKDSKQKEHPTILLLKTLIPKYNLKQKDLETLVEIREFDAQNNKFQNIKEYEDYIDKYLYQLFYIITSANQIELSKPESQSLKNLCYILKTIRVINSLPKKNYNDHPFIPRAIAKEVHTLSSIKKQEGVIKILKEHITSLLDTTQKLDTNNRFLQNFQNMVKYQAYRTLKYSSSTSITYTSPLRLKVYLWWKMLTNL